MNKRHDDVEFEKLREENGQLRQQVLMLKDEKNALEIDKEEAYDSGYEAGQRDCDCSSDYDDGYDAGMEEGRLDCEGA